MKKIVYKVLGKTAAEDVEAEVLCGVERPYSEANVEIAKSEAYSGEYTIEDDGQPEPEQPMTDAERIAQLEEALELLLNGVTE
jgi:hypothetical protein